MTRIAVVTSGFPRLSETFLAHELRALDAAGMLAAVFATKPGDGSPIQPAAESLLPRVHYLRGATAQEQASELVADLRSRGESVDGVHGYFAHLPAEVARAAARAMNVPFGFSVHARDARKIEPCELAARVRDAAVVVACNNDVEREVRDARGSVELTAHGVDLQRFVAFDPPAGVFSLLAVGRLVEKKGFHVLLDAVAKLEVPFRLRIIGEGKLRAELEAKVAAYGLHDCVSLPGATTHDDLPAEFAAAHVVVAPSVVDASGDRDGLPNVVLEAMASGRPVVGTDAGAIATAVEDGRNGFVVPAGDAGALAARLHQLAANPALAASMGRAARSTALNRYDLAQCTARFLALMERSYG